MIPSAAGSKGIPNNSQGRYHGFKGEDIMKVKLSEDEQKNVEFFCVKRFLLKNKTDALTDLRDNYKPLWEKLTNIDAVLAS